MKKLTSLEDTATITITGREAVMLHTIVAQSTSVGCSYELFSKIACLLSTTYGLSQEVLPENIDYASVQASQEEIAFPQLSKKDLMLKELQSKMDDLQCEIDKIKGETF